MATPNRQSSRQQTPGLLTHLRQSIHSHRLKLSVVTGKVKATQNDMTLLLTGSNHDKAYFKNLIFGDNCTEKSVHTVWQWALERFIRKQNADLLVAVNPGTAIDPYLRNRTPFISPMWVRGELDFDVTSACQKKISIKADLSKIRKNNLSYIVTKDPRLFDYFYHEMHVPHASNAHGKAALPIAYGEMKQLMHSADLFLVKKDDEFIAGGIIAYVNGKPRAWANGVKDGNPDYVKMGALSALYYFNFLHLEKKGFKSIHIGSSKPFLNDGVLQYKKKWGMRLTGTRGGVFAIDILKLSDGTKSFLVNNPFIQLCDNKLTGACFLDSDTPPTETQLRKIQQRCYVPGMDYLQLQPLTRIPKSITVPDDLKDRMRADDRAAATGSNDLHSVEWDYFDKRHSERSGNVSRPPQSPAP